MPACSRRSATRNHHRPGPAALYTPQIAEGSHGARLHHRFRGRSRTGGCAEAARRRGSPAPRRAGHPASTTSSSKTNCSTAWLASPPRVSSDPAGLLAEADACRREEHSSWPRPVASRPRSPRAGRRGRRPLSAVVTQPIPGVRPRDHRRRTTRRASAAPRSTPIAIRRAATPRLPGCVRRGPEERCPRDPDAAVHGRVGPCRRAVQQPRRGGP